MRSNDIGGDNRTGKLFIFLSSLELQVASHVYHLQLCMHRLSLQEGISCM